MSEALEHAQTANEELRELAHGILPAALTHGGLRAGVDALASRMPMPVEIDVSRRPAAPAVEATAYFVVAEALTNVAKHARAGRAAVAARLEDGTLRLEVRDDGVGGARADGSGLIGLADRLAVLDGGLRVESPAGGGRSSPRQSLSPVRELTVREHAAVRRVTVTGQGFRRVARIREPLLSRSRRPAPCPRTLLTTLRPISSLWWLPVLFGVVTLGIGRVLRRLAP